MRNVLGAALIASMTISASIAQAGGPVLIEEGNNALIEEGKKPGSAPAILPVLGVLVLVCLLACRDGGGSSVAAAPTAVPAAPEPPVIK